MTSVVREDEPDIPAPELIGEYQSLALRRVERASDFFGMPSVSSLTGATRRYRRRAYIVCRPNEKSRVERLVEYIRSNFLVPVPQAASLDELNARLMADKTGPPPHRSRSDAFPPLSRRAGDFPVSRGC